MRYSEDIDLTQIHAEPIGKVLDRIREVFAQPWLRECKTSYDKTQRNTKLVLGYSTIDGHPVNIKVEINTTEHFQVLPCLKVPFSVESEWFTGSCDITTYELVELMATKLRALYQRKKGRDLFDLWYTVQQYSLDLDQLMDIFRQYLAHDGIKISKKAFQKNMKAKILDVAFQHDTNVLFSSSHAFEWDVFEAHKWFQDTIIERLS